MFTLDQYTVDSTGAYLRSELDRLDQRLYEPLSSVTWGRDINLRTDVTISDETTSYILQSYSAAGGITPPGKAWYAPHVTTIPGVNVDGERKITPLRPWAMELSYDVIELARAQSLGRPLEEQKLNGLNLKYQMDVDEMVYVGDKEVNAHGLVNSPLVTTISAAAKGNGSATAWAGATPDEILADVNTLLTQAWLRSGYTAVPSKLLLPPTQFGMLTSIKVSEAGNISVLEYLAQNSLANRTNGAALDIQPLKWLVGQGAGGTDRIVAYTNAEDRVRFPLVPLQRGMQYTIQMRQSVVYYALLGEVENVYPETMMYMDGV